MFFKQSSGGVNWLLVCLGNPGDKYENTRHNVGYMVADELAGRQNKPVQRLKFKALTNILTISGEKVLVMKPITYMNLSGEAVRPAADFYKVPPERVLVVSDDTALAIGRLRIRAKGSAGGHNGLKNIIQLLGTDQFPRLRVGVGEKPHPDYDMADWVLGRFAGEDKKAIDASVKRAADAVACILAEGIDRAMGKFNGS
ncbi:MAG: aminoacyl-tRNA hydrolase [Lawsonibacter sp.]|nr:aminoacyl-tRNA hydrolase [Lawsonibacter sp.]